MTEGEEGVQASRELVLPSRELHGVWENLIYDEGIKEKLLRYVNMGKHLNKILKINFPQILFYKSFIFHNMFNIRILIIFSYAILG